MTSNRIDDLIAWLDTCVECGLRYATDDDHARDHSDTPVDECVVTCWCTTICWSHCDGGPSSRNEGLILRLNEIEEERLRVAEGSLLLSSNLIRTMNSILPKTLFATVIAQAGVEHKADRSKVELGQACLELDDCIRESGLGFGNKARRQAAYDRVNKAFKAARKGGR